MRELNIDEALAVSGGGFTNLEIILGSGFAGSILGGCMGAYINSNVVSGSYSTFINLFASGFGIAAGAPIGLALGFGLGGLYIYLASEPPLENHTCNID